MSIFGREIKQASEGVSAVFDSIGGMIDSTFTSQEEKDAALQKLKEAENEITSILVNAATERHKTDMQSDNFMSKNVRPFTLAFILFMLVLLYLMKAIFGVEVSPAYLSVLEEWGGIAIMFYFGSRALEKTGSIATSIGSLIKKRK